MTEADGDTTEAAGGRRVAVLGEMLELGDEAVEANRDIVGSAAVAGLFSGPGAEWSATWSGPPGRADRR
jgi:UDP-N-acetylmuramyl pentapeptide synthase